MKYMTVQKKAVVDFFKLNSSSQFTIEEVLESLQGSESCPGKSSLYRIITQLVADGEIKRFVNGGRHFVYQLAGCQHSKPHLHLKCTECGALTHIDEETSDRIVGEFLDSYGFEVNCSETVIVGKCEACK